MEPDETVANFIEPLTSAFIKSNPENPIGLAFIYTGITALSRVFPLHFKKEYIEISAIVPNDVDEISVFDSMWERVDLFIENLVHFLNKYKESMRWLLRLPEDEIIQFEVARSFDEAHIMMSIIGNVTKTYDIVKFIIQTSHRGYYKAFSKSFISEYRNSNPGNYYAPLTVINGVAQPVLGYLVWDTFRRALIDPLTEVTRNPEKDLSNFYSLMYSFNKMEEYGSCEAFASLVQRCTREEEEIDMGSRITSQYIFSEMPGMTEYLEEIFNADEKSKEKFLKEFVRFI